MSGMGKWSAPSKAFTVVELIVVISVIAVLSVITAVTYTGWRNGVLTTQVKADLKNAATAVQSKATFENEYPSAIPTDTFTATDGVTIDTYTATATTFCISAYSVSNPSIVYHIDQELAKSGEPEAGGCGAANSTPAAPTNVAVTSALATTVNLSWTAPSGTVTGYTMQCAQDAAYINTVKQNSTTSTSGTVTGVDPTTGLFCRVRADNANGTGAWSNSVSINTTDYTPPSGLAATTRGITSLTLTWNSSTDADSYTVECAKNTGYSSGQVQANVTATTTTFNNLDFNTPYYCHVKLIGPSDESDWSSNLATSTNNQYGSLPVATSIDGYWTAAPAGYLIEDGSAISRTQYADLFAVIGTTYGAGNGSTTFNLPDSRGLVAVNRDTSSSEFANVGQKFGAPTSAKSVTLTTAQIPSHNHTGVTGQGNSTFGRVVFNGGSGTADNHYTGYGGTSTYVDRTDTNYALSKHTHNFTTNNTGGGGAHENMQPTMVKVSAIKYTAIDSVAPTLPAGSSIAGYWTAIPSGYVAENGSAISRTTYSSLFSAIGTTYGAGNGSSTFNVPDSVGATYVNLSPSETEFSSLGNVYGEKTHTLTMSEMPLHTHTGTTGNGNAMTYRLVHQIGTSTASDHIAGWNGSSGYADYTWTNYPLQNHTHNFTTNNSGSGSAHNEIQPSITKTFALKTGAASGSDDPVAVGTSVSGYWTSSTPPSGYLAEDGATVSRTTYAELFSVLGTTYGAGNGSTTFRLPDSRGEAVVNRNTSDGDFDAMTDTVGQKTVLLTIAELPSHSHTGTTNSGNPITYRSVGAIGGSTQADHVVGWSGGAYTDFNNASWQGSIHTHSFTTNSSGGNVAHNNVQPTIVKRSFIKF